jgi:DNA-directed RNA polymerase subunit RPC12/RpoP
MTETSKFYGWLPRTGAPSVCDCGACDGEVYIDEWYGGAWWCAECVLATEEEVARVEAECPECEEWETFWCSRCGKTFKSTDGEECIHCGYVPRLDDETEEEEESEGEDEE